MKNLFCGILLCLLFTNCIPTNEAKAEILIYDLNTLEVLSQSSADGKVEVKISADDTGWDYVDHVSNISRSAFS